MPRTRSTKGAPSETSASPAPDSSSKLSLGPQNGCPPTMFVFPKKASSEARIVTLPNPRTSRPSRYLVCPETGIYEFTKTMAPKTTPRSWLIETTPTSTEAEIKGAKIAAQVTTDAGLFLATAIDPIFLLLPAFVETQSKAAEDRKRLFLSSDDYFDKLPEEFSHLTEILQCVKTRSRLEARMNVICDTVEAGDETMFRLSESKLVSVLIQKAERMSEAGLPSSMELKFVKKPLEAPISIQQKVATASQSQEVTKGTDSGASTPLPDSADSQSTTTSNETDASAVSSSTAVTTLTEPSTSEATFVRAIEATPEIVKLQRLRVAFSFICSSYVPPAMADQLQENLSKNGSGPIAFGPLDDYLAKVASLRAEAVASRPVDMYSRKHGRDEIEDEMREKRQKLEDEKKKKAKESRTTRDLKKVDTTGMKKLSAFFKKK